MRQHNQTEPDKIDELSRKTQLLLWLNIASVGICLSMLFGALLVLNTMR